MFLPLFYVSGRDMLLWSGISVQWTAAMSRSYSFAPPLSIPGLSRLTHTAYDMYEIRIAKF